MSALIPHLRMAMLVRNAELDDVPRMMALEREAETAAHWTELNYNAIFTLLGATTDRISRRE